MLVVLSSPACCCAWQRCVVFSYGLLTCVSCFRRKAQVLFSALVFHCCCRLVYTANTYICECVLYLDGRVTQSRDRQYQRNSSSSSGSSSSSTTGGGGGGNGGGGGVLLLLFISPACVCFAMLCECFATSYRPTSLCPAHHNHTRENLLRASAPQ